MSRAPTLTAFNELFDRSVLVEHQVELLAKDGNLLELRVRDKRTGKIQDCEPITGANIELAAKEILAG